METPVKYKTKTPDRVTRLRLQAEGENISKDAMEAAIEFVRHDAGDLSDLQIHNLAVIINRKLWAAFEKGQRSMPSQCARCDGDVEPLYEEGK